MFPLPPPRALVTRPPLTLFSIPFLAEPKSEISSSSSSPAAAFFLLARLRGVPFLDGVPTAPSPASPPLPP